MKITFVIPSRNNLEFLQLAYKSIRDLETKHEILVLDDASTDGTYEWIKQQNDVNLSSYRNHGPDRIGIVGMFDKGIETAKTDIIMAFHADMVVCKDFDKNILKHLEPRTVVSATRVEPPLHPDGPEKIIRNFGIEPEEFDFEIWYNQGDDLKKEKVTEGIFAPWCMFKTDFLDVGGHDILFAPQSKEDSDLFNRFYLNGYKLKQSWDALVYHFTSRGSRFNKHSGGAAGKNSDEWLHTTSVNMRNFIRKWGHFVMHDQYMKPIVPPKYNIGLSLLNSNPEVLYHLEPWFDKVYVDNNIFTEYIRKEQPNTSYNLKDRVFPDVYTNSNDIIVRLYANKFTQEDFNYIQKLSQIIEDSGEVGRFTLGNLNIEIRRIREYQQDLIVCK